MTTVAEEARCRASAHRARGAVAAVGLAVAAALGGCGSSASSSPPSERSSASTAASTPASATPAAARQVGFEGIPLERGPLIAPAESTTSGTTVHGIACGSTEQLAYHIHAHLSVFLDGSERVLPAGIGIPGSKAQDTNQGPIAVGGSCIYWLHTHTTDGVIHIESPTQRRYTLGEFFDEWHQPLSRTRVGTLSGRVSAYVNGRAFPGDPRTITLGDHAVIQLDLGRPVPAPSPVSWAGTQL